VLSEIPNENIQRYILCRNEETLTFIDSGKQVT